MSKHLKQNVQKFDQDVAQCGGYRYSGGKLSSRLANQRISDALDSMYDVRDKKILDVGCGDGTYTIDIAKKGPALIVGVDPSENAVRVAKQKLSEHGLDNIRFEQGNIYELNTQERFDCIVLRGVLHHLPDPKRAVACLSQLSDTILIIEPNGANPVLKGIEKYSKYHVEHEEQSFLLSTVKQWCQNAHLDFEKNLYVNLVPMFCPDWMARSCKIVEPIVERIPFLRNMACGQYIILTKKA